jgi:hypothetical protein
MKGLLLRLSALDADAAAALRVIAHFEALLTGRLDAETLVRSTAGLAECPAGLELDGRIVRFGPSGAAPPEGDRPEGVEFAPGGTVWLEREGEPGPFDDLVLEWMAIAAGVLAGRAQDVRPPHVADPALVELVLSEREAVEDRARALRLLGLDPGRPLRVVAVAGVAAVATLGRRELRPGVRVASVGPLVVALVPGAESPAAELRAVVGRHGAQLTEGVRIGVGGSVEPLLAGASWAQARLALRFAAAGVPQEAVVDHDDLGPVALLAEIPVERLRAQPDVRALRALADGKSGDSTLAALAAFCRTGTLRQAAAELHLHHSTVAVRLAQVESALGWHLNDPRDRFRAQLALHALRLAA